MKVNKIRWITIGSCFAAYLVISFLSHYLQSGSVALSPYGYLESALVGLAIYLSITWAIKKIREDIKQIAGVHKYKGVFEITEKALKEASTKLFSTERLLSESYTDMVKTLVQVLEKRDLYTYGHSNRVTQHAIEIAMKMGLSGEEIEPIPLAGVLHDIGKTGISDIILGKPEKLTEEEFAVIKRHPEMGKSILAPLTFLAREQAIILHHHERYDGKGYPENLKREEIPLQSRILAVADAYDAMTSVRPYRQAKSMEDTMDELRRCTGSQFDPRIVEAFMEVLREKMNKVKTIKREKGICRKG